MSKEKIPLSNILIFTVIMASYIAIVNFICKILGIRDVITTYVVITIILSCFILPIGVIIKSKIRKTEIHPSTKICNGIMGFLGFLISVVAVGSFIFYLGDGSAEALFAVVICLATIFSMFIIASFINEMWK
jgi:hypothetical protein